MTSLVARMLDRRVQRMRPHRSEHLVLRFPARRSWTVAQLHAQVRNLAREVRDREPWPAFQQPLVEDLLGSCDRFEFDLRMRGTGAEPGRVSAEDIALWSKLRQVGLQVCAEATRGA